MGATGVRWLVGAAVLALQAVAAQALTVTVNAGSLRDQPSVLRPAASVPASSLRPVGADSSLSQSGPTSGLRAAAVPDSAFRLAEVPPARLEATRALLVELKARQDERRAVVVDLPADVLFDFDSARLRPDAEPPLAKAAELLRSYAAAPVEVHGHTDSRGTAAYNDALSTKRAQAVAERLQAAAGGRTLAVRGLGATQPVAPNAQPDGRDDPDGRQRNRRVQIVIQPS